MRENTRKANYLIRARYQLAVWTSERIHDPFPLRSLLRHVCWNRISLGPTPVTTRSRIVEPNSSDPLHVKTTAGSLLTAEAIYTLSFLFWIVCRPTSQQLALYSLVTKLYWEMVFHLNQQNTYLSSCFLENPFLLVELYLFMRVSVHPWGCRGAHPFLRISNSETVVLFESLPAHYWLLCWNRPPNAKSRSL